MLSQADRIGEHVVARLAKLAKARGPLLAIRAGDVVLSMGLVDRTPAVCSVLRGTKFLQLAGLELAERNGPAQSTTTTFPTKPRPKATPCGRQLARIRKLGSAKRCRRVLWGWKRP